MIWISRTHQETTALQEDTPSYGRVVDGTKNWWPLDFNVQAEFTQLLPGFK